MIYDEPIFRPLGDCYLGVEFGDEADLALNFRVLALKDLLDAQRPDGVVDIVPTLRELGVIYDRARTTFERVSAAVRERLDTPSTDGRLRSRRFVLPVWYDDPWSAEIAARAGDRKSIDFVAFVNDIDVPGLIGRHTGTDHWCTCVGWAPGCYFCYPMDRSKTISAPKLRTPREFTPARTLTLGGPCTAAMPVSGPSGYQMLGRLAINIYEPIPRNRDFPPDGVLFRAGDRHRYRSIDPLEYEEIWEQVAAGTYQYDVVDEFFDTAEYLSVRKVDASAQESVSSSSASAIPK